jgi:glycosyltransferase involved in cell wall biosynthesis
MAYPGYIEKNFMRVLEAVHLLRSEPWFAELELIVIGKGKAKEKLVTFAKELGIDSAVTWVDAATNAEVQALQRSVSFVVLASIHEGMSSFALESLKNGAGLLVSRNTGVEDMVREGHNGFLFDPYSTRDIARCIKSAVETLLPKIEQVRSASLAHFADNFSSARVLQRFDEIWTVWEARNKSGLQEVGQ